MSETAPAETPADEPWGPPRPERVFRFFWFTPPSGGKFTHLDLTGAEVLALQESVGAEWLDLAPVSNVAHRMAILETFEARTNPEDAKARVGAMTMKELDDAIDVEYGADDDLPTDYEDGVPKAADAP